MIQDGLCILRAAAMIDQRRYTHLASDTKEKGYKTKSVYCDNEHKRVFRRLVYSKGESSDGIT